VTGGADPAEVFDSALLRQGRLTLSISDGIATVTLDAPDVRNAQLPETWRALEYLGSGLVDAAVRARFGDVRVVLVRGAGASFSSGLDRSAFGAAPGSFLGTLAREPAPVADKQIASFQAAFAWLSDPGFVSIAAVQGHAVGAGFQLALACDLIVAADDARFSMAEVTLGLVPDLGGTDRLVRAVGRARALELCVTGRRMGAAEAVRAGLALMAVPADELAAAATDLARAVSANDAETVRAVTRLVTGGGDRSAGEQRAAERTEQITRLRALSAAAE
jgi:enoyl-CoA hydratase/carnithine racemase